MKILIKHKGTNQRSVVRLNQLHLWFLVLWGFFINHLFAYQVISLDLIPELNRAQLLYEPRLKPKNGVLILCPGVNGNPDLWMKDLSWITFCRKNGLGLVGLSFSSPNGHREGKGYYYPERGSGDLLCKGIRQIYGELPPFYLFGFSGGAHFVHRFSIYRPALVKGFVAYSAAWWADIPKGMIPVLGLIMCGESDPRLEASRAFWLSGVLEKQPWIWRSYSQSGHEIYPQAVHLSRCFFEDLIRGYSDSSWIGDTQTYEFFNKKSLDVEKIPLEARVQLTSKAFAEEWKKE